MADLYEVLGVARDATEDDIKRAYRKRARSSHPDAGGDEDEFKSITHAYEVLSDRERRARYDRFGDDGTTATRGQGDPFGAGFGGLGDVIDAFFGQAFGGGPGGRPRDTAGRDVLRPTSLTLEEVAAGVRRTVDLDVATSCDDCGGIGSTTGGSETCPECHGRGQVQRIVRTAFGQLSSASACPRCHGDGVLVTDPCPSCSGQGRVRQRREVTVDIPPGVNEGDRLRVTGQGEAGQRGARAGDLYVEIRVAPHELFERDGRDLWAELAVPMTAALLGARLSIPTVDGDEVEIAVDAGAQPGDVVTVRRRGLPRTGGGGRGDLNVRLRVDVPTDLDDEQRDLVRRLAALRGEDAEVQRPGLLSRLRGAFR